MVLVWNIFLILVSILFCRSPKTNLESMVLPLVEIGLLPASERIHPSEEEPFVDDSRFIDKRCHSESSQTGEPKKRRRLQ